ncbi:serine hydrolase domain-containing protein [Ketobacter alkanivorans]|uniref:Serine hydrolase n=1 Tax=Ketobacter alkanivorans TaxID=1917421 RepID=A0A2K9LH15_9GAMM|nr:serine hydrolase domain-containing protein [Ketobacter alkanivorans]AUM11517.1 serine hydrolase [Ketobacter alkanivorans]
MLQGYVHPDFGRVAEVLSQQIPRNRPGGAALSVYHKGQCVVDIWGGTRNRDGDPWRSETLSLSFSTTKGVASTLLHILVDQGYLNYDDPVSKHWPEFGQKAKQNITVRQLLCHEAGMYHIREMIDDAEQMMDWNFMTTAIERAKPVHEPGTNNGYHALTYGWLIGELVQRVTSKTFAEVLDELIAAPLQLDGLYVGLPEDQMHRRAELVQSIGKQGSSEMRVERRSQKLMLKAVTAGLKIANIDLDKTISALVPKGAMYLDYNSPDFVNACVPAANGMFTARSLAKLYAVLANGGELDGIRLISRETMNEITQIQNRTMGDVIPVPMHWRLGYHRVFALGKATSLSFGHFGFGGSGAWADPVRKLSVGLTLNNGVGTPFGDARILQITGAVIKAAEKRYLMPDLEQVHGIGPFFPRDRRSTYGTAKKLVTGVLPRRRKADLSAI